MKKTKGNAGTTYSLDYNGYFIKILTIPNNCNQEFGNNYGFWIVCDSNKSS